nr:response regulator [bacterium]
ILMDIRMPVMDGIAATAEICADPALIETRVLILTTFEEDEYLVAALRAGDEDLFAQLVVFVHGGPHLHVGAALKKFKGKEGEIQNKRKNRLITYPFHPGRGNNGAVS